MKEIVQKYINSGLSCLPCRLDKSPYYPKSWLSEFELSEFDNIPAIGIKCGDISSGLECLDFDNHFNDAIENLKTFLSIPEVNTIYQKYKLPIESTQRGGFHLLYRCHKNEGNRKLAQRLNDKGKPEAIIETRGNNGYFVAAPSPGYKVIRNDILNIELITELERAVLINHAVSMNEYEKVILVDEERSERPGDIYNTKYSSVQEAKELLKQNGWTELNKYNWCRPDKLGKVSATFGKVAENVFYVFTSNAHPFDSMKGYTPFQILALLKYNGDFKQAAQSIAPTENKKIEIKQVFEKSEIEKILQRIKIDTKQEIEKPPVILSINEFDINYPYPKRLFTLGNFSAIIGKAKSKKTFLLSLLTACMMRNINSKIVGNLPKEKELILWLDTEQANYDTQVVIKRIITISGTEQNLFVYNLREFTPNERCQIIEFIFESIGNKIGFCVIDGIADLANAINDELEATRISSMLLRLTAQYNCHISAVIHQNKNDNFATGHVGSSIMKKAEIIISVTKDKQNGRVSIVKCDMSRAMDFKDFSFIVNQHGIPEPDFDTEIIPVSVYEKDKNELEDAPF